MPPPSHGRRLPHRKDKRSLSRSRSRSRSRSGYRKKPPPKQKYPQSRFRSRSRSGSRSRTPKKQLPQRDRKYDKYPKHNRRSLTPPRHRNTSHGKSAPARGKLTARKESYRSPSRSYSRSLSRSRSRSPIPRYGKNRKRADFSPKGDSSSSQSPRRGGNVRYNKATESYTTTDRYNKQSPQPGSSKRGGYSDTDMRAQRYGVSNTDASYSAPAPERKKLLTERFKDKSIPSVQVEENITIGIHRTLSSRKHVSNIIIREFNPLTDFKMLRHTGEGRKPLFDREEVKKYRWDDKLDDEVSPVEERRVITVAGSSKAESDPVFTRTTTSPPRDMDYRRENTWRDVDERIVADDSYHSRRSDDDYDRRDYSKPRIQPEVRLDPRPDPRYEHVYRQHEYEEKSQHIGDIKLEKIQRNPNDLRHNLMKKHERRSDEGESLKYPAPKGRSAIKDSARGRMSRSPVRFSPSPERGRNRPRSRSRSRSGSRSRSRSPSRSRVRSRGRSHSRDRSQDKYRGNQYKSDKRGVSKNRDDMTWKERVDLAREGHSEYMSSPRGRGLSPRGRGFIRGFNRGYVRGGVKTFGHDDRDKVDYGTARDGRGGFRFRGRSRGGRVFRGGFRGRGGFQDRGGFRGGFRGRGGFRPENKPLFKSRGPSGTWKHDMFDKLEAREDDQKPSSTTEK